MVEEDTMAQTTEAKPSQELGFTLGLVLGAVVGASLGTLLAPQSGSDTRSQLAFQSERLRKRLTELREALPESERSQN